jgi:hypothetical protein
MRTPRKTLIRGAKATAVFCQELGNLDRTSCIPLALHIIVSRASHVKAIMVFPSHPSSVHSHES